MKSSIVLPLLASFISLLIIVKYYNLDNVRPITLSKSYFMGQHDHVLVNFNTSKGHSSYQRAPEAKLAKIGPSDVIHLATFVQHTENTFELMVFLKSIFVSRQNSLHLHAVIGDAPTKAVVLEMLDSWQVEGLDYELYEIQDFPNFESSFTYSGATKGRWKMDIPIVLKNVEKVIVADVNMQVVGDIANLWNTLLEMQRTGSQLGLVDNVQFSKTNAHSTTAATTVMIDNGINWVFNQ